MSAPDSVEVTVVPLPKALFDTKAYTGYAPMFVHFNNSSSGFYKGSWNFGDDTLRQTFGADTDYVFGDTGLFVIKLMAENSLGCVDSVWQAIHVTDSFYIFIPNAFTPNNDGHNDTWEFSLMGVKDYRLFIFDRWGEKVYWQDEKKGFTVNWDGVYKGFLLPEGVYSFLLEYNGIRPVHGMKKGMIHLER